MSNDDRKTVFTGSDELTADQFLRIVRTDALQQDRSKDDEWIAQYAAAHLGGPALLWYEGLSEETQESWKLLRRELLIRWSSPNLDTAAISSSSSNEMSPPSYAMIDAPAAAPPQPRVPIVRRFDNERRGRIRAVAQNGQDLGFVSRTPDSDGDYCINQWEENALIISFIPSNQPHEIRVSDTALLGVTFHLKRGPEHVEKKGIMHGGIGVLTCAPGSSHYFPTSTYYKGEARGDIWNLLMDGTITMSCHGPRCRYVLEACVSTRDGSLTATTNYGLVRAEWGTEEFNETPARLVFDPIF